MDSFGSTAYQFCLDPSFPDVDFANFPDFSQLLSDPGQFDNEPPAKRTRMRAAKACLACRSRHMKCDSVEPKCTRCQLDAKTCIYTKSRRGGSHKLTPCKESPRMRDTSTASNGRTPGLETDFGSFESLASAPATEGLSYTNLYDDEPRNEPQEPDLISLYYRYFHSGHPIVLPSAHLLSRRKTNPSSLEHLIPVMEYIGAKFDAKIDSSKYEQIADKAISLAKLPANGFSVQTLVLYALAKHADDWYDIADIYVDRASNIALSIGMERREFAALHGEGASVLEESWRRTSWTLYMTDAAFAAIGHRPKHRLQNVDFVVDLPCEDLEYETGDIPSPRTFEEYDNREFLDEEDIIFSSMTYLIDAIRIASSTMSFKHTPYLSDSQGIIAADAKFVNWFLYLPRCKQEAVNEDGTVDETMFLALITLNIEKVLLHRPYSALAFSDIEARSKCTPPADQRQSRDMQRSILLHTAKVLEATTSTIMMFALPAPFIHHSPLAICALALAVMAQVSACKHVLRLSDKTTTDEKAKCRAEAYGIGRDRVRLGLGALRSAVHVWGLARRSVREVVGVSKELLTGDSAGESPD